MQIDDKMYNHLDSYTYWKEVVSLAKLTEITGYEEYKSAGAALTYTPVSVGDSIDIVNQTDTGNIKGISKRFQMNKDQTYTFYIKGTHTSTATNFKFRLGTTKGGTELTSSDIDTSAGPGYYSVTFTSSKTQLAYVTWAITMNATDTKMTIEQVYILDDGINLIKDQRFYDLPSDMIKLKSVYAKDQLNKNGEYHVIPRYIGDPPKEIDNE